MGNNVGFMGLFEGILPMVFKVIVLCFLIFGAMVWDFMAGIHKAKLRGEARTSYGFRRSISKFLLYYGGMFVAFGVDCACYVCDFWVVMELSFMRLIPVVAFMVAVFILVTEGKSIVEKAENKVRKEMGGTARLIGALVRKEEMVEAFTEALKNVGKGKKDD